MRRTTGPPSTPPTTPAIPHQGRDGSPRRCRSAERIATARGDQLGQHAAMAERDQRTEEPHPRPPAMSSLARAASAAQNSPPNTRRCSPHASGPRMMRATAAAWTGAPGNGRLDGDRPAQAHGGGQARRAWSRWPTARVVTPLGSAARAECPRPARVSVGKRFGERCCGSRA